MGKGCKRRAYDFALRGKRHKRRVKRIVRAGGCVEVRLVFTRLDEAMAFALERSTISYWRCRGVKLQNLTAGGDGTVGYCWTPDQKHRSKVAAVRRWEDPVYRDVTTKAVVVAMQRPDVKLKLRSTPERAKRQSVALKRSWATPEVRASRLSVYNRPGQREKHSAATKAGMSSESCRAKVSAGVKALWADESYRTAQTEKLRNNAAKQRSTPRGSLNWKLSEAERAEVNRKRALKLKELYADPAMRAKVGDAVKAARASPEARHAMSVAARKASARPEVKEKRSKAAKAAWARRKQQEL